jgi:hypothetical protein
VEHVEGDGTRLASVSKVNWRMDDKYPHEPLVNASEAKKVGDKGYIVRLHRQKKRLYSR